MDLWIVLFLVGLALLGVNQALLVPGAGLVAEVVVRKYADHCPLERQSRIFCQRYGITLSASTLGDWVGGSAQVLEPLYKELLGRVVDGGGEPLDGRGPLYVEDRARLAGVPLNGAAQRETNRVGSRSPSVSRRR